jgi:hypothetical protein
LNVRQCKASKKDLPEKYIPLRIRVALLDEQLSWRCLIVSVHPETRPFACHSEEQSDEESLGACGLWEILRFAQNDNVEFPDGH